MRIAYDVTSTLTGATGIARYVTELGRRLDATPGVVLHRFAVGRARHRPTDGTRWLRVPLRAVERSWATVGLPRAEHLVGRVDTVHASGPLLPPSRRPTVAVVYDLAPHDHPELHPARHVRYLRSYLDRLPSAAATLAISETTAARLVSLGTPEDRVHVAVMGRTPLPPPERPPLEPGSFVLAVGAPVARKRFDVLVRAIADPRLDGLQLVIVGPPGAEDEHLAALADRLGVTSRLHRPGAVSDAELAGWYEAAAATAMPSVEEGFGLPLIESLAAGTPVVASDIPVFHEVTGGHAALVDPSDLACLVDAIGAAARREPEVRAQLDAGRTHVSRYTWEATAAATLAVHRAVAGR